MIFVQVQNARWAIFQTTRLTWPTPWCLGSFSALIPPSCAILVDACSNNEMLTFNLARTMLVLHLVLWMGGSYILEQPSSSLMKMHPRVKQILDLFGNVAINTFLGPWGHWTAKLTTFFSNQPPALNFANVSAAMPFIKQVHFNSALCLRGWISHLYRRLTQTGRVDMDRRRLELGYEKPTRRTASGVTGTRSLRTSQLPGCMHA